MNREFRFIDLVAAFLVGVVFCFGVLATAIGGWDDPDPRYPSVASDPTVTVVIYPADALEAGEPQRMPLSQAVRNAAAGVPVTLVGVE